MGAVPSSLMITSCQTILEYHSLDADVDMVKTQNISILKRLCMLPFYNHSYFLINLPSL